MTKKILLVLGILAIIGVAAFLMFSSKPAVGPGESRVGFSIRDYLPFGNSNNTNTDTGTTTTDINDQNASSTESLPSVYIDESVPRLRKISNEPVAGAVVFNIGTTSVIRFIEKGTGNVYEARSNSVEIKRLTNTTIPKIIRAFWLPTGSGFLAQTLVSGSEIIETNFVKLNKNAASSTNENLTPFSTTIGKLPTDIKEISIKPDGAKMFYYTTDGSVSNWFVSNPDGTGSTLVMSHPLTEWIPKWISGNTIIMQNKGSSETIGYTYSFDTSSKTLKKTGIGTLGLFANTNTDGSLSLISNGSSNPRLSIVDNKNVTSRTLETMGLAEKCVWLKEKTPSVYCAIPDQIPNGNYPDVWFKGLVSTQDSIKKIDVSNDIFYNLADLSSISGEKIDVVDMSISPDETHLIFRNKIDGYLWLLRAAQ